MGLGGATRETPKLAEAGRDARTEFKGHTKLVQALGWNCDGTKLASASAGSDVRVWSVETHKDGKEVVLEDHKQGIDGLSWSPTSPDVLATGSADKMIRLWDLRAKKSLKIETPDEVLNVAYSANGDYIAMSDKSENVRLVDVRNGKNKMIASASYDKEYWVNELTWQGPDCLLMCAGRQKADVQEKGIVQVIKANCTNIAVDSNRNHFATGAYDGSVCIWDAQNLVCLRPACTALEDAVASLSFSFDGAFLAAAPEPEGRNTTAKKMIDISAVSTGQTVLELATGETVKDRDMSRHVKKIAWHPSQHLLAFAGDKTPHQEDRARYGDTSRSEFPVSVVSLKAVC